MKKEKLSIKKIIQSCVSKKDVGSGVVYGIIEDSDFKNLEQKINQVIEDKIFRIWEIINEDYSDEKGFEVNMSFDELYFLLFKNKKEKNLIPNEIKNMKEYLSYLKDIGVYKDLVHFKNATQGLYAFDKNIDDIFDEVIGLKSKTIIEQLMLDKINYLRSIVFKIK